MRTQLQLTIQKTFKSSCAFFLMCFVISESFAPQALAARIDQTSALMQSCLNQASRKETANARDAAKLLCLNSFASHLSVAKCLSVARSMAYFSTSNKAKLICGSDIEEVTAQKCLAISREITYSETADELKWTCLARFKKTMSPKQCTDAAKEMSLLPLQNKAIEFCTL